MKAFHIYNEPPIFDMLFGLFSPLIKEKMKSRVSKPYLTILQEHLHDIDFF